MPAQGTKLLDTSRLHPGKASSERPESGVHAHLGGRSRAQQGRKKAVLPTKERLHFKKNMVKLSCGEEGKQDVKSDEAGGRISQVATGDLFNSSFTTMVWVEFI